MRTAPWIIIVILLIVVAVMAWFMLAGKVEAPTLTSTSTTSVSTSVSTTGNEPPAPLHERVIVKSPKAGATVADTFDVTGEAPGNWYFEATFPIQVRDKDGNVIGRAHANAQGEWMTENQVAFTTTVNIDGPYKGPATLILLRDNPSGLPENDDSLEVAIVIK